MKIFPVCKTKLNISFLRRSQLIVPRTCIFVMMTIAISLYKKKPKIFFVIHLVLKYSSSYCYLRQVACHCIMTKLFHLPRQLHSCSCNKVYMYIEVYVCAEFLYVGDYCKKKAIKCDFLVGIAGAFWSPQSTVYNRSSADILLYYI